MAETKVYESYGFFLFKIENHVPKILLLQSTHLSSLPFHLSIPKGKAEESDYSTVDTALRELLEETDLGVADIKIIDMPAQKYVYSIYKDDVKCEKSVTGYFAVQTSEKAVILSDEHINFEWASKGRLYQLLELGLQDFLLTAYVDAINNFEDHYINNLVPNMPVGAMMKHFNK